MANGILYVIFGVGSLSMGGIIGYFIAKKTKLLDKLSKDESDKNKIINNPDLLLEKLNNGQPILDYVSQEEITYSVEEVNGKRKIVEHRRKSDKKIENPADKIKKVKKKKKKLKKKKKKDVSIKG